MDKKHAVPSSTEGDAVVACPQTQVVARLKGERVQEPLAREAGQPESVEPGMQLWLKGERVQVPATAGQAPAPPAAWEGTLTLELALDHPQPMTIELLQGQVVLTLSGWSG